MLIPLSLPGIPKSRCASLRSKVASVAPARLSAEPKLTMPTMVKVSLPDWKAMSIGSPTANFCALAVPASITTSPGAFAPRPLPGSMRAALMAGSSLQLVPMVGGP